MRLDLEQRSVNYSCVCVASWWLACSDTGNMADVPYIVSQLNAAPFNMKLQSHKFSDLKGLDLLQTVR